MKSSLNIFIVLILFFACSSPRQSAQLAQENTKPNIILFYADDLGWMDLGIQGSPYYKTPHIDRIALEGLRFTNAYANAANCAPSRASLMTGCYSPRHGIYTVGKSDRGKSENRKLIPATNKTVLDQQLLTLPQFLKNKGYRTCMAGKWHLSNDPLPYGFDENFGGFKAGHPKSYFSPYKNPSLNDGPEGEHLPDRLANEITNWISKHQSQPFFAYFSFYSVHTPIQARKDLIDKYKNTPPGQWHNKPEYAAMIEAMDQAVGKVLKLVDDLGLAENTLIIFTSDNGAHGGQTLSRPLRGAKGMYYEGGIRVPFLVKSPKIIKENTINDMPIIGSDIFPTIIDLVGEKTHLADLDGQSLLSHFKGIDKQERSIFWHFPAYLEMYSKDRAFEDSHDKPLFRTTPVSVIRQGNWKLLEFFETGETELYNLEQDKSEKKNLANRNPKKRSELYKKLKDWQKKTNAFLPVEKNSEYLQPLDH